MHDNDLFANFHLKSEQKSHHVPDMIYVEDFLTAEEASRVVTQIDNATWIMDLKRRVQHYGYKYNYRAKSIDESMRAASLPLWAVRMGNRLVKQGLFSTPPDQVIVNEYLPGQGIATHIDCVSCFGEALVSVSLLSPCLMTFASCKDTEIIEVDLMPGSAVLLTGQSRYDWKHGIIARKTDRVAGITRQRRRRISVTFRTVIFKQ